MEAFLEKHNIRDDVIAVGVSGGADSLALVLMAKEELAVYGRKVVALTVNHKLRPSADAEAEYVAEIMQKYGIEHHILVWNGEKPQKGIEEEARKARYNLMQKWCAENGVKVLLTAHHLQDQVETFLMHLQRGSGLAGLCGMHEVSAWKDLQILRPLLHTSPQDLRDYLQKKSIHWVEDESNQNTAFLRNKIRKFLPEFYKNTQITAQRIDEAVSNLQSAEEYILAQTAETMRLQVKSDFGAVESFKYTDYLSWHKEIKFRILAQLCRKTYIPRADSVLNLVAQLNKLPFKGATLGGKEIILAYNRVWLVPELDTKHLESRKGWEKFVLKHQEYLREKIPHKVKLAIMQKMGTDDDL